MRKRLICLLLILTLFLFATVMVYSKSAGDVLNVKISPATGETGGKTGEKVRISFWFANNTPEREAGFKELIRIFEKQNPGIQVDLLGIPGDSRQKLDMAIAANEAPDCFDVAQSTIPSYIARDSLVQLDNYFDKWPENNKILPAGLDLVRSYDPSGKNRLFAIPTASDLCVLWLRPDWFAGAGLKPPRTWDEFFKAVKVCTNKNTGHYGVSIQGGIGSGIILEYLMYSYSGLTKYFTSDGKCTINDPKHVEFVAKYLGLYNVYTAKNDFNNGRRELAAAFQSGKAAMVFDNISSSSVYAKNFKNNITKFAAVPPPKGDKGYNAHSVLSLNSYVMYSNSNHKEETWKFLSYLCSAGSIGDIAKFSGIMPMHKQALKSPWIQALPYFKMAADILDSPNTKFFRKPFNYQDYNSIMSTKVDPMIQLVMGKKISVKDFLNEWARLMLQMKDSFNLNG